MAIIWPLYGHAMVVGSESQQCLAKKREDSLFEAEILGIRVEDTVASGNQTWLENPLKKKIIYKW